MKVTYTNSFRDVLAGYRYMFTRTPVGIGLHLLILIGTCWPVIQTVSDEGVFVTVFVCTIMLVLFYTGLSLLMTLLIALMVIPQRNNAVLTEHSIAIDEDMLIEKTEHNRSEFRWSMINKVVKTRRHLLIFVSSFSCHIVPRHAFVSREEGDAFYAACLAYSQ